MKKQSKKKWISPMILESDLDTTSSGPGTANSETPTFGMGEGIS